jgi:hypothetical protein
VIIGGGMSRSTQMALAPPADQAIYISTNAHGLERWPCDYTVCLDNIEDQLRQWDVPIVSTRRFANIYVLEQKVCQSGMLGAYIAWVMGCSPIFLAGIDCYQGGTYEDDPEARSGGRKIPLKNHLMRWRKARALIRGDVRTFGGPLAELFPVHDSTVPAKPAWPAERLYREVGGTVVQFEVPHRLAPVDYARGSIVELPDREAKKLQPRRIVRILGDVKRDHSTLADVVPVQLSSAANHRPLPRPTPATPPQRRSIVITRPFNGIGDWLMALNCVLFVNRQRPDVDVYVDFRAARTLPDLIPQAFAASNVRITSGRLPPRAKRTSDSLVYRKLPPQNYIESMVHHLNDQIDLGIEYERHVFPQFGIPRSKGDYIVMLSQGKRRVRGGKEWGTPNLQALAIQLIAAGIEVRQIGSRHDCPLTGVAVRHLGASFHTVAHVLASARAFVGLENGIMILAGFLRVPQVTIYDGASRPQRVDFDDQLKLTQRIEPPQAAAEVLKWLP